MANSATDNDSLKKLAQHVQEREQRLRDLQSVFDDVKASPLTHPEFTKFLCDHYCELAMRYVLTGSAFPVPMETSTGSKEEELLRQGFVSSGSKTAGIDPALLQSPAARAAIAAGANLTSDPEDASKSLLEAD
jgi:hypothetical protein